MAKRVSSKILAIFMAFVMVVGLFPASVLTTAFAAEIDSYSVRLTDGAEVLSLDDVEVTLTNKTDAAKTATVKTVDGIAVFESFVEEEATYEVSVAAVTGYKDVTASDVTIAIGEVSTDVVMTALAKVTVSGIVSDEQGKAYAGAKVTVSGYTTVEVTTDAEGKYSFDTYAGKEIKVKVSAKAEDVQYAEIPETTVSYGADTADADYQLTVKTFTVETKSGDNGTITATEENVPYGADRTVKIEAKESYRIKEVLVNGEAVKAAEGQQTYEVKLEKIAADQKVEVSFYEVTYTVSFDVKENGSVTYNTNETAKGGEVTKVTVSEGGSVEFTATANAGYHVEKVSVGENEILKDGGNEDATYNGSVESVSAAVTVTVEFEINQYSLSVGEGIENGSAVWSSETVENGGAARLDITPDAGYAVSSVTVNDEAVTLSVDETGLYVSLENITGDKAAKITFAQPAVVEEGAEALYEITYSEGARVKEYKDGETRVIVLPQGATATITPANGYTQIKLADDQDANLGFAESVVVAEAAEIKSLYVAKSHMAEDKALVKTNVKVVFDAVAPVVSKVPTLSWTYEEVAEIGEAEDEGGAGLSHIVWSEKELSVEEVLNPEKGHTLGVNEYGNFDIYVDVEKDTTYYFYAVDFVGNVSEVKTVQIQIDKTAPAITGFAFESEGIITTKEDGTLLCNKTIMVTITAEDEGVAPSGIKKIVLYRDGKLYREKTVEAGQTSAVFELKKIDFNGGAKITATVIDIAGNDSGAAVGPTAFGEKSDMVQITSGAPTVTIEPVAVDDTNVYDSYYSGHVNFQVTVKQNNVYENGISKVTVVLNDKTLEQALSGDDFTQLAEGVTEVNFIVGTSQLSAEAEGEEIPAEGEETPGQSNSAPVEGDYVLKVIADSADEDPQDRQGLEYSHTVTVDTTAPAITNFKFEPKNDGAIAKALNFLTFGTFFNEEIKITVTADDNGGAGVDIITLYMSETAGETFSFSKQGRVDNENKVVFVIEADQLDEGKVYAHNIRAWASDKVGNIGTEMTTPTTDNSNAKSAHLMLEAIVPNAGVSPIEPAEGSGVYQYGNWYNGDVEFTANAGDAESGLRDVVITINDNVVNAEVVDGSSVFAEDGKLLERVFKVTTEGAEKMEDGAYKVEETVTDNAGNVVYSNYTIYKDVNAPYISNFEFKAGESQESGTPVTATEYGFYFRTQTNVVITAVDDRLPAVEGAEQEKIPSAGIKAITYYLVDFEGVESDKVTVPVDENNQISITVPAKFKGQIYAKATDNVENTVPDFVTPSGVIVETQEEHDKAAEDHVVLAVPEADAEVDGKRFYGAATYDENDGIPVTITVADTYTGIASIEWFAEVDGVADLDLVGKVTVENDGKVKNGDDVDDSWETENVDNNLVTEMKKILSVKHDSNNIKLVVKMTDRAGNTTEETIDFGIDKTAPVVTVAYGDDEVEDEENANFFSTTRTATITVKEKNFNAADVSAAVTMNDEEYLVALKDAASWTVDPADPETHIATVKYEEDGHYGFVFSYADIVGNRAEYPKEVNPDDPEAPVERIVQTFTIDLTDPVVSVVYDNNAARNGNYYNANRTATITVVEHNFDENRVNVVGNATDNGANSVFPATSNWSDLGNDTYTATIAYTNDSRYTFDITVTDKAGRVYDAYEEDVFFVDKTAPSLSITGVDDRSANNGDVIPVITYSDTNFDENAVSIALSGANNGDDLDYAGVYAAIANGQRFTYANFEKVQKVDDIYTLTAQLTDMAGNQSRETIVFSVNRFGSVYDLSGLRDILGKYFQEEKEIVFTETNVDELDREGITIKLTKNGAPTDLVEGEDYTVEESGGNGQWHVYTYRIKKTLFADDGRYSLSIYSEDAAGNVNENIEEAKAAEISFGIDKTKPVIVPTDFESGMQYAVDKKTVSVEIKDNLVLEGVKIYLNGQEIEYAVNGEIYTFDIPKSNNKQSVKIVAVDAAGNEEPVEVTDFLVNANIFVRWFNNTPLFVGSIIGIVGLSVGAVYYFFFGKKRKSAEE